MDTYTKELEKLIVDVLLPAYSEYARITGKRDAMKLINSELLQLVKSKRPIPALLKRPPHGSD
jgi:hypothetical protein